jgi:type IV secretory pathway TraG/TraD family ATPase VirD4
VTRRTPTPGGALSGGSGDLWTDALLLAGIGAALAAAVGVVVWVAGTLLSLVTGHGHGPGLTDAARRLVDGGGLDAVWPGLPAPAVIAAATLLGALLVAAVVWVAGWWRTAYPRRDGYAPSGHLAALLPGRAGDAVARRLRPSLTRGASRPPLAGPLTADVDGGGGELGRRDTGRVWRPSQPSASATDRRSGGRVAERDRGVPLGVLTRTARHGASASGRRPRASSGGGRRVVRATWEDVVLAVCAPRTGKTTCLAVPAVLDAPGPVLATSNKADLWQLTARPRAAMTGERVWTFDPQDITGAVQGFAWNPLAGIATVADARRLAGHFIQEIRRTGDHADFWDRDAEDLLTGLLLAAAIAGAPIAQVGTWLTAVSSVEPRNILTRAGFTQLADTMAGRSQGAHETREGVYATARAAAACLADPQIMAWVTPRPGLDPFDPAAFVHSAQTLYLLSKDGAGSAAPLVAAFADRLMLDAVRAAEHSPAGRLDPPLVAVLDEAANICRIAELPRLYSHLGSRGVVPVTILQSRSQGRRVWGERGMDELFSAATIKVIGAGIDDPTFADDISRLLGDEDVLTTTRSTGKTGGTSTTTRRERVLAADDIRALPKFTALLLVTGVRPALLRLVPWMHGPHAKTILAATGTAAADNATLDSTLATRVSVDDRVGRTAPYASEPINAPRTDQHTATRSAPVDHAPIATGSVDSTFIAAEPVTSRSVAGRAGSASRAGEPLNGARTDLGDGVPSHLTRSAGAEPSVLDGSTRLRVGKPPAPSAVSTVEPAAEARDAT